MGATDKDEFKETERFYSPSHFKVESLFQVRVIPSPIGVYETNESSSSLIKKINYLRLIIYLDDILEELEMGRGTLIFLLQRQGFVINVKKFVLSSKEKKITKFLGIIINSIKMESCLSDEKVQKILMQCQKLVSEISICEGGLSVDKNYILNSPNSPISSPLVLLTAETANRQTKNFPFLRKTNSFIKNVKDSSEWMLNREIFQKLCSNLGKPKIDL